MATTQQPSSSGSNGFLYFAVGALIVAVGVLGYMYYSSQQAQTTAVERSADAIGDAADRIGDSVSDAAQDATRIPPQTTTPAPTQPEAPTN